MLVYQLAVGGDEKKLRLLLNDLLNSAANSTNEEAQRVVSFYKVTNKHNNLNYF